MHVDVMFLEARILIYITDLMERSHPKSPLYHYLHYDFSLHTWWLFWSEAASLHRVFLIQKHM